MSLRGFTRPGLAALAALSLLAASGVARAQYTSGVATDGRAPYTNTYIAPQYAPAYDARILDAPPNPRYSPIMMTSINYPGVYGAYTMGIEARDYRGPIQPPDLYAPMPVRLQTAVPQLSTIGRTASIDVRLPADAELWFQGVRMNQGGVERRFVTPPLMADRSYGYDVRATWTENGQTVVQNRFVRVNAGEQLTLDLNRPAPAGGTTELRTVPIR